MCQSLRLFNVKMLSMVTGVMLIVTGCFPDNDKAEYIVKKYSSPVIIDSTTVACVLTRFNEWECTSGYDPFHERAENFTQFILAVNVSDSSVDTLCRMPRILNGSYDQLLEYIPPFLFICNVVEEDGTSSAWRYSFTSKKVDKFSGQARVRPANAGDTVYDHYGALYRFSTGERLYLLPIASELMYCNALQNMMILRTPDRFRGGYCDYLYKYGNVEGTIDTIRMNDSLRYYKSTNKSGSLLFRKVSYPDTVFVVAADSLDASLSHRYLLPISGVSEIQGRDFDVSLEDHLLAIDIYDGLLIRGLHDERKLTLNNERIAIPD